MFRQRPGFSLVEVLIVVVIVGVILTLVTVSLNSKQSELRDTKRHADIQALRDALELVRTQNGSYEPAYCGLNVSVSACGLKANSELLKYLPRLVNLKDPDAGTAVCNKKAICDKQACDYAFMALDQNSYEIWFHLEKALSPSQPAGCYRATPAGVSKL